MELTNIIGKTLPNTYIKYLRCDELIHILPRLPHEQNDLATFAESIHRFGLIEPIRVFFDPTSGKHYIISGERRFAALSLLGRTRMICHVITDPKMRDATIIAENCLKEGADIFRACRALEYLIENCGYTPGSLAHFSGIPVARINRLLKLGLLSAEEKRRLSLANMSEQVCAEIALIDDYDTRSAVIDYLIKHMPTMREALDQKMVKPEPKRASKAVHRARPFKCELIDNSVARLKRLLDKAGFASRLERKVSERELTYTISLQK
ncbi:MAG: ParB N-terminal domain-containing protein [Clostridia bacterium]|nr:ParB N-terminal domain-containing protein [Clostridia bacterium]